MSDLRQTPLPRAVIALALLLVALPANAQRALVYCPVSIDHAGCDRIVTALQADTLYRGGIARAYNGASGTIDLRHADWHDVALFVVPSLADFGRDQPYALLRDTAVVRQLRAAITGRRVFFSGTLDQGRATARDAKDALLRHLARWATGTSTRPGLLALQDQSAPAAARYSWARELTGLDITADSTPRTFDALTPQTARGAPLLGPDGPSTSFPNIASFGFRTPRPDGSVTVAATGGTGTAVLLASDPEEDRRTPLLAVANAAPPHFQWAPPLATSPLQPASLDPAAAPVVEICAWSGTSCLAQPIARFRRTPGAGELPLTIDATSGWFEAQWSLLSTSLVTRRTYRIRVLEGTTEVGAISVDAVRGRWAPTSSQGTLVPLAAANSLPVRFVIAAPGGVGVVGPAGATLTTSAGAVVTFQPGTLTTSTTVTVHDTSVSRLHFFPLGPTGTRLVLPLGAIGVSGGIAMTLPLSRPVPSGEQVALRLLVVGMGRYWWANVTQVTAAAVTAFVPIGELQLLSNALAGSPLDMTIWVESIPATTPITGNGSRAALSAPSALLSTVPPFPPNWNCVALPAPANRGTHAPCGDKYLRPLNANRMRPNEPYIVLVHGWMPDEVKWSDYYYDQGISCTFDIALNGPQCAVETSPRAPNDPPIYLPANLYFQFLAPKLLRDFPAAPFFAFEYESFDHIPDNAAALAAQMAALHAANPGAAATVIGHSMGGVVSDVAVELLEKQYQAPSDTIVAGLLALAAPLLGSPLGTTPVSAYFKPGAATNGGNDLALSWLGSGATKAQFFFYGGTYTAQPFNKAYTFTSAVVCAQQPSPCKNDGAVPLSSALPAGHAVPVRSTMHPVFSGYNHTAMMLGEDNIKGDPGKLYAQIVTDICLSLPCIDVDVASASVLAGSGFPVHAKIRGIDPSSQITWSSLQGHVSVTGVPTDPILSGTSPGIDTVIASVVPSASENVTSQDTVFVTVIGRTPPPRPPRPLLPPPPPQSPTAPTSGASYGDPHLRTMDGRYFDLQSTGDFVLTRSTDPMDDFQIQARYERTNPSVSITTAVAMRVEGTTVTLHLNGAGTVDVTVGPMSFANASSLRQQLPGGGSLLVDPGTASVSWPDGSLAVLGSSGVTVYVSPSRKGAVEGLLGNFDGDRTNDLRIRGGALVDSALTTLYTLYAPSWRVALGSPQSLFSRGPDPWDPAFPAKHGGLNDLDPNAVNVALGQCAAAGLTHPDALDACAYDLVVTGAASSVTTALANDYTRPAIAVTPRLAYATAGQAIALSASVSGLTSTASTWSAASGTFVATAPNAISYTVPTTPGTYVLRVSAAASSTLRDSAVVIVTAPPVGTLRVNDGSFGHGVGAGLQSVGAVRLPQAAPASGAIVTLESSDPTLLLLATRASDVGSVTIQVAVPAFADSALVYFNGIDGRRGSATVRARAVGYLEGTAALPIVEPEVVLWNVFSQYPFISTAPDTAFLVAVRNNGFPQAVRPGGSPISVTAQSSNPAVATLVSGGVEGATATTVIPVGSYLSPYSTAATSPGLRLHARSGGTTDISVISTQPSLLLPRDATTSVSIVPARVVLQPALQIGEGLSSGIDVLLAAPAPPGGTRVTLVSADPTKILIAPDAQSVGSASLVVVVPAGARSARYTLNALEGTSGARVYIRGSIAGYLTDSAATTVVPSVVQFAQQLFFPTTATPMTAIIGFASAFGVTPQPIRPGGQTVTLTVSNSVATVARLLTAAGPTQQTTVVIIPGQSASPLMSSPSAPGVQFQPLAPGQTILSLRPVNASRVGLAANATQTVTIR